MSALLLRAVDFGILGVVFLAPLFMGGRHPVGELVYVALVAITATAWCARKCVTSDRPWIFSGAEWWIAACVAVILLQLASIPESLLELVSPATGELLPFWSAATDQASRLGTWSQVSLSPESTRGTLVMFLAHSMLFLVIVQWIRSDDDVERLLRWVALAAVAMAGFGLFQFLLSNGKFFWFYDHPFRETRTAAKGAFTNANHFAHFLALGLAPLVWWFSSARKSQVSRFSGPAITAALGIVLFAGLLTFSRGGVIVMLFALALSAAVYALQGSISRRAICGLGVVAMTLGSAVVIFGLRPLTEQLSTLQVTSLEELDAGSVRLDLWSADLKAFSEFSLLGTGGGSHVDVYLLHFELFRPVRYTHAESGYFQVLLEFGIVGGALLLLAIAGCSWWCFGAWMRTNSPRRKACAAAVSVSLLASLVHSIWDFVWYIPACMSLTVVLAACACRMYQLSRADVRQTVVPSSIENQTRPSSSVQIVWGAAMLFICATSTVMVINLYPAAAASSHWDDYLRLADSFADDEGPNENIDSRRSIVDHLTRAFAANPNDPRTNLRLAGALLIQFELQQKLSPNPMPLVHIREVVLASGFPTPEERDKWLAASVGENRNLLDQALYHSERALHLCPLQGEAYVYLAQLDFLSQRPAVQPSAYIEQALRLRPKSGVVLLAAGLQAIEAGDIVRAATHWRQAFRQDPRFQRRMIATVAPLTTPAFFLTYFQPDAGGLGELFAHYRASGRLDYAAEIAQPLVAELSQRAASESGDAATRTWMKMYEVYRVLDNCLFRIECLGRALQHSPRNYKLHQLMAREQFMRHNYEAAIGEIRWCLSRKPNDRKLKAMLAQATKLKLRQASAAITDAANHAESLRKR